MKRVLVLIICLVSINAYMLAQNSNYSELFNERDEIRRELWEKKQYKEAIDELLFLYKEYNALGEEDKTKQSWVPGNLTYNLSCAYSLTNSCDDAIKYLNLAVDNGYRDYYWVLKDSDLDNIRDKKGYNESIARLKDVGDYKHILKKYPEYKSDDVSIPSFKYDKAKKLKDFRVKYNLDSIAGNGDEFSRMVNLMSWVHGTVSHDGNSNNPKDKSADALITICKKEDRGVNCRMMATILNEAYLAMGYKSRFVTCKPKRVNFNDCHVINMVYSTQYNKWLWMDPSFEAYVVDEDNIPLGIQEVRERLINDKPLKVYEKLNWNGNPYSGGEQRYLHEYMAKNLFRFEIPLHSVAGYESKFFGRTYIELYPVGYNPNGVKLEKKEGVSSFFIKSVL